MSDRSDRLLKSFKPDREARFFSTIDQAVALIKSLLSGRVDRAKITSAAQVCVRSGNDNDSRLRKAIADTPALRSFLS